jgi:hypothetical protein
MMEAGAARSGRRTVRLHARPAAPPSTHGGQHEAAAMTYTRGLKPGDGPVNLWGFAKAFYPRLCKAALTALLTPIASPYISRRALNNAKARWPHSDYYSWAFIEEVKREREVVTKLYQNQANFVIHCLISDRIKQIIKGNMEKYILTAIDANKYRVSFDADDLANLSVVMNNSSLIVGSSSYENATVKLRVEAAKQTTVSTIAVAIETTTDPMATEDALRVSSMNADICKSENKSTEPSRSKPIQKDKGGAPHQYPRDEFDIELSKFFEKSGSLAVRPMNKHMIEYTNSWRPKPSAQWVRERTAAFRENRQEPSS